MTDLPSLPPQPADVDGAIFEKLKIAYEQWEQDDMPPEVTDALVRSLYAGLLATYKSITFLRSHAAPSLPPVEASDFTKE